MENYKFIILMIIIDIIILIISEILMKKYLKRKMLFPKTRLIKGSGVTNDDLDINNSVFLHMTDGIIAFDRNGVVILINPAAKQMMNISPQDTTFEDIFGRLHINLEKIIYLENWTKTEERFQIEDRFVNVYFAPFKKENDRTVGVIAVIQDITEHVKLDNMRKEFIADVSHELKTPITSIMGYADTLLEGEYDKETIYKWLYTFCHRFFRQQFKRSCLPDGPKVGSVAVSPRGDLRMPSDACAAVWLQQLEEIG